MRQTRTSIDTASEHTLNYYWNEESDCTLSEECQIKKTKLSQQVHMGKWSTHTHSYKRPHGPTRSRPKNGPDCERRKNEIGNRNEEKTRLQEFRRNRGIFEVSLEDTDYLEVVCEPDRYGIQNNVFFRPCGPHVFLMRFSFITF